MGLIQNVNVNLYSASSVERIYLRQRSSDGTVNKTILKPRLALAVRRQYVYVGFSRRKISRSSAARWQPRHTAKFRSLYDIMESNPVPASGLWSGSGSNVNQFVHVLNKWWMMDGSVETHISSKSTHAFLSNLANRQTNTGKNMYPLLCRRYYSTHTVTVILTEWSNRLQGARRHLTAWVRAA